MFDKLKQKSSGLFSGGEDRGVSPVIGVILMVAITVILAAVIGMFVLDMSESVDREAQASVSWETDTTNGNVTATVTSMPNAESIEIRGEHDSASNPSVTSVGSSATVDVSTTQTGEVTAVGITESGTETVISTYQYDIS